MLLFFTTAPVPVTFEFIDPVPWRSDKSWEPGMFLKTWKPENFENIKNDHWDMLNNFCFHVYAQKSLFIAENCNGFFGTSPSPVSLEFIELVPS